MSNNETLTSHEREYIKKIPLIPPQKAYLMLEEKGYRGQKLARRALCLAAYRHIKRIKKVYLENIDRETLPPKNNVLIVGPTGCGKTHLIELLFQHILKLPTVVVDITGFSETGYIGEDTKTILTRLLLSADGNPIIASTGIICLDEFDKLASNQNITKFDGQGSTKDVSGYGVQRELLKMLETSHLEIPADFDNSLYSTKQKLFTGDVTFIACGAFSNLKSAILSRNTAPKIGYKPNLDDKDNEKSIAYMVSEGELNDIINFQNYGFIPELIGRFTRLVPMLPLDKKFLKAILKDNVINKFKTEFATEGLELEVEEAVLDYITNMSYERQTGARGLGSLLTQHLEATAFEHFCGPPMRINIKMEKGKIASSKRKIRSSRTSAGN